MRYSRLRFSREVVSQGTMIIEVKHRVVWVTQSNSLERICLMRCQLATL